MCAVALSSAARGWWHLLPHRHCWCPASVCGSAAVTPDSLRSCPVCFPRSVTWPGRVCRSGPDSHRVPDRGTWPRAGTGSEIMLNSKVRARFASEEIRETRGLRGVSGSRAWAEGWACLASPKVPSRLPSALTSRPAGWAVLAYRAAGRAPPSAACVRPQAALLDPGGFLLSAGLCAALSSVSADQGSLWKSRPTW